MRHNIQVLDRLRKTYASLRPSEQRVADYVLNHPETCTQQTISELADQVQVSQPTVVRFVQALGFGGFRNFKYCLLRDRSQGTEREAYFDHLGVADVAVAFSHSGCSMDTVKALKLARKAGAGTIAITSRKNPLLARYADVCLCTGGEEAVIYGTAIFSRIPDLAVVDLLYMGIIQSDYERFSRSLDKSGAVIADRGYPEE